MKKTSGFTHPIQGLGKIRLEAFFLEKERGMGSIYTGVFLLVVLYFFSWSSNSSRSIWKLATSTILAKTSLDSKNLGIVSLSRESKFRSDIRTLP